MFKSYLQDALQAVAPLVGAVCVLQILLVQAPLALFVQFLGGSLLAVSGMVLLFAGIDLGILPMGRYIGAELPKSGSIVLIAIVAFCFGFATTVAEPDVIVLSEQVQAASAGGTAVPGLIYLVAGGVGLFGALALWRIVAGVSMTALLSAVYSIMIVLSFLAPAQFIPLAYDAGSVTTGVLTAPVILALAIGLSSVLAERSAVSDGFGVLGLASVGPIVVMLLLGLLR